MHETDNLNFTPLALEILKDRYLHRDTEGNITETPKQMLRRVADAIAPDPWTADTYYNTMANLDFLPNSPTLMNAGRPYPHGQLAACFVIGIEDTMESICEALRKQMLIHKTGGGTGFNFSNLRPKNSTVNSTNGHASGPVSFMRLFDLSTEVIQQGGMRRGANMAILNADHPDIKEFISCKDKEGCITNFNLSVGISDDFMKTAVSNRRSPEANLLYDIAKHAWKSGDPGVIFLDTLNRDNHRPDLGVIDSTNPCGESPLFPNEACNLGSINLSNMYNPNEPLGIDWKHLRYTITTATQMLDDIIDTCQYPLPEIKKAVMETRKIGLGVMGFADLLIKLKIPYNSPEALKTANEIMGFIHSYARITADTLAANKSHTRNETVTCCAPTGTLALLANCSSGIEPIFSLSHTRTITKGDGTKINTDIYNPAYEQLLRDNTVTDEELRKICVTAYDINYEDHIKMQSAFQRHTDLAVSKTINMSNEATADDIYNAYIMAWTQGCKGITVYRDGSRASQVLIIHKDALPEVKCSTC